MKFYLLLLILCLFIQGFYASLEMACVSFNKVRLQYYVSKNQKRAIWLSYLLNHPAQLFGTTLIAINTALQFGSECARQVYLSLGLSPDLAPLTQVILVLIFAEISPMVSGRRYAEHIAMLGMPILYFTSIFLRPVIALFDVLCSFVNKMVKSPPAIGNYLSREELQKMMEASADLNTVVANIFTLKTKTAKDLMKPLKEVQMIPSFCTVVEMRRLLTQRYVPFLPIYHPSPQNIVAIAYPRDLLRLPDNWRVREKSRPPWFITQSTSIIQILKQFRKNNQVVAVVLSEGGQAVGILTLDEIVDELMGQGDEWESLEEDVTFPRSVVIDRTFPADMLLSDFNKQFHAKLHCEGGKTLEDLFITTLGHTPTRGESIRVGKFELEVEEASLLGVKMIAVRSK